MPLYIVNDPSPNILYACGQNGRFHNVFSHSHVHIMSNHLNGIKPSQQLNINLKIMFNTLNMYLG